MKRWIVGAMVVALSAPLMLVPEFAEAKRLGGGKSQGMQRSAPERSAPQSPPAQQATPAPTNAATAGAVGAPAAAAAAAGKRSWMGPIAALAAGVGLAALLGHFGLGGAFANFLMLALLAVAAIFVVRWLMRRFAGGTQNAGGLATAAAGNVPRAAPSWNAPTAERSALPTAPTGSAGGAVSVTGVPLTPLTPLSSASTPAAAAPVLPAGFDLPAFERIAKMIFIRLQAANDAADLDDLRQFTTPEMFAAARLDLQDRGGAAQQTDVERVEAEVVEFVQEDERQIVSVRFHGLVREERSGDATAFDEVWHLVKPADDSRNWAIAGIQPRQ